MLPHLPSVLALLAGCGADPGALGRPNRLALGGGVVYVSDFQNDRIVEYRTDGTFVRTIGEKGLGEDQLWRVVAMTLDDDGSLLVANRRPVSDDEGAEQLYEVKRFVGGSEVERHDLDGEVVPDDAWIEAVEPMGDGRLLVADSAHGDISIVREGRLEGRLGGIPGSDAAPTALARERGPTPAEDRYWVVEQHRHRVGRLDARGMPLPFEPSKEAGPLSFPSAIAACPPAPDREGFVVVADLGNLRVVRFSTTGAFLGAFAPEPVAPDRPVQLLDVALSEDCAEVWLVDSKGDRVLVTDLEGTPLRTLSTW